MYNRTGLQDKREGCCSSNTTVDTTLSAIQGAHTVIYSNLLYFLVAIFLFTMTSGTDSPSLTLPYAAAALACFFMFFDILARSAFARAKGRGSAAYFKTEKRFSVLALLFYANALYLCDIRHYLSPLSISGKIPSFINFGGLAVFIFFLLLMWRRARPVYETTFGRRYSNRAFLGSNLKANLPIILPWAVLSLLYDLIALLPFPELDGFIHSRTGDIVSFIFFLLLVVIFFPPMVRRLWGCTPFPDSPLLDHLQQFFKKQNFSAKVYIWPLFEGRVLTAGVMGVLPGLRYVLVTPALLESLTTEELDAVMAHEIGHIKKKHLFLYLLIIAGFSVAAGFFLEPLTFFLLSRQYFYTLATIIGESPETLLAVLMAAITLLFMVLYFRFLFGFFIRNFERQADLHVFDAIGSSHSLISAFEKIAVISGNTRDHPSWHHFGIGQRVSYLEKCEADPSWITRHNRKVRFSLLAFALFIGASSFGQSLLPSERWTAEYEDQYLAYNIEQKHIQEPDKAIWLRLAGDLMQHKKMEKKALLAYQKALQLEPENPNLLNNYAWLLLTAENKKLRDPLEALSMARFAAMKQPQGHILDTLATAYWANNFIEKAVETEKQAIFAAPPQREYYLQQIDTFQNSSYENNLPESE